MHIDYIECYPKWYICDLYEINDLSNRIIQNDNHRKYSVWDKTLLQAL